MNDKTSPNPQQQELYSRSQDIILVFNPTDKDIQVGWDLSRGGINWLFPNRNKLYDSRYDKGFRTVPRYIAIQYLKYLAYALVDEIVLKEVSKENTRRTAIPGGAELNRWEDRLKFEENIRVRYATLLKGEGDNDQMKKLVKWEVLTAFGSEDHPDTPTNTEEQSLGVDLDAILRGEDSNIVDTSPKKGSKTAETSQKAEQSLQDKQIEELSQ